MPIKYIHLTYLFKLQRMKHVFLIYKSYREGSSYKNHTVAQLIIGLLQATLRIAKVDARFNTRQCDPIKKEVIGRVGSCLIRLSYRVSQKKYTSIKSYIFVLRTNKSLNCASFVRQGFKLNET